MTRPSYPCDLTHEDWHLLEPERPALKTGGRPRSVPWREIVNGILYVLRTGCAWRSLRNDLPAWSAVYHYFRLWRRNGTWKRMHDQMRAAYPSAGMIDRQSVKTNEQGVPDSLCRFTLPLGAAGVGQSPSGAGDCTRSSLL